jgi:hypothetical protein
MGHNPQMPQITIRQWAHGKPGTGASPDIGLAARVVAAYIQLPHCALIAVDLRRRPQIGDCPTVRAADCLLALFFSSFHFVTSNLCGPLLSFLPFPILLPPIRSPNFRVFLPQNALFSGFPRKFTKSSQNKWPKKEKTALFWAVDARRQVW